MWKASFYTAVKLGECWNHRWPRYKSLWTATSVRSLEFGGTTGWAVKSCGEAHPRSQSSNRSKDGSGVGLDTHWGNLQITSHEEGYGGHPKGSANEDPRRPPGGAQLKPKRRSLAWRGDSSSGRPRTGGMANSSGRPMFRTERQELSQEVRLRFSPLLKKQNLI